MPTVLTANEARVIGCLMEKSVISPDTYPLTLNALTNACNQKSARDPVMALDPGVVRATVRALEQKHLVRVEENFRTQVEKFTQRLCNTPFSDHQFDAAEFAVMCVLLLRGPRTPGEIRANSGRLHTFDDNAAVVAALEALIHREGGPLVAELPRAPGRRDNEYVHLFGDAPAVREAPPRRADPEPAPKAATPSLEARVERLEAEVAELRRRLEGDD